jgi:hypothetical protein
VPRPGTLLSNALRQSAPDKAGLESGAGLEDVVERKP